MILINCIIFNWRLQSSSSYPADVYEWRRRELNPSLVLTTKGFWGRAGLQLGHSTRDSGSLIHIFLFNKLDILLLLHK